jgi:hypothetical protein
MKNIKMTRKKDGQTNINLTGIYCGLIPTYMYYGGLEKNTKIIKNATFLLSGKNKNKFLHNSYIILNIFKIEH